MKLYKRSSSHIWSPSNPNQVVPCTGRSSGNQPKMQAFDYFCWAFGAANIWICVSRHLDMKPLKKYLVLDNDKDEHVMSQGGM